MYVIIESMYAFLLMKDKIFNFNFKTVMELFNFENPSVLINKNFSQAKNRRSSLLKLILNIFYSRNNKYKIKDA